MVIVNKGVISAAALCSKLVADDQAQDEKEATALPFKRIKWPCNHKAVLRQSGTKRMFASLNERSVSDGNR